MKETTLKSHRTFLQKKDLERNEWKQFILKVQKNCSPILSSYFGISSTTDKRDKELFLSYFTMLHANIKKLSRAHQSFQSYCSIFFPVKEKMFTFILLLSYYNLEFKSQFIEIYESDDTYKKDYSLLKQFEIPVIIDEFEFECCCKIGAVLLNLHHSSTKQKVKSFIEMDSICEKTATYYDQVMNEEVDNVLEMAQLFICHYLEDSIFLASFSPFLLYMQKRIPDFIQNIKTTNQHIDLSLMDERIDTFKNMLQQKEWNLKKGVSSSQIDSNEIEALEKELDQKRQALEIEVECDDLKKEVFKNRIHVKKEEFNLHNLLIDKKVCIVGGHENLIQKINESYPEIGTISMDQVHQKIDLIKGFDLVLFYYLHMHHNAYETILKLVRKENIPYGYLSSTNINRLEKEISQLI